MLNRSILISITLIASVAAHANEHVLTEHDRLRGCFTRIYANAFLAEHPDQTVTAVKLNIYASPLPGKVDWFSITIRRRGEAKALKASGYCQTSDTNVKCFVEDDGGGIRLTPRSSSTVLMQLGVQPPFGPNGEAIKQDERIRISSCGQPEGCADELNLTGGEDDHEFLLSRTGSNECAGMAEK